MLLLKAITFLAAFLLFQIELIIAKLLLPFYGGSFLVWGACVVFFQTFLLLGYVFTHFGIKKLGIEKYRFFHLLLVLFPLLFFPGRALVNPDVHAGAPLALDVFWQLLRTIGPVFFVLSTVSLLTQSWLSRSNLPQYNNPYALYAVSNLGSFGALLSYPFYFEAQWTLSQQLFFWRVLYGLLIALTALTFLTVKIRDAREEQRDIQPRPDPGRLLVWLALGAAGSILFLSVNNVITSEIAPIPLLWIVPLGIYLLSFVLNFKKNPWCPAWIVNKIDVLVGLNILLYFIFVYKGLPVAVALLLQLFFLFVLCMYCQRRLIELKPSDDHLTLFYVFISLGSFIGGLVITWIFPLCTKTLLEYFLGLGLVAWAVSSSRKGPALTPSHIRLIIGFVLFMLVWPQVFKKYNFWGMMLLVGAFVATSKVIARSRFGMCALIVLLAALLTPLNFLWSNGNYVHIKRNYYGIYLVFDDGGMRKLAHGTTLHGGQLLGEGRNPEPVTYYGRTSPIGQLFINHGKDFKRIGVVGLGTGTIAAYISGDQELDYYELDPDVYEIASKYFTFLPSASGKVNMIFGDARLSLQSNKDVKYDLIIVDAFSGDAVPVHLLTKEMLELYRQRLTENGVIIFHISNRYLRLGPGLVSVADTVNARWAYILHEARWPYTVSMWTAMTWSEASHQKLLQDGWESKDLRGENIRVWTDDYSNFLPVLKMENLISSLKNFKPFYW